MAAQNGIGAANAAMYGGNGNNVVLSSPGYHSDMLVLMENMERLSGTLQRNRQEWSQVQEGLVRVERLQGRLARDNQADGKPQINGDASVHEHEDTSSTVLQLQGQLAEAHRQIADLGESFAQLQAVHEEYSAGLSAATQMARSYQSQEQSYIQSVHEHYSAQLLQARTETVEAQLTHQAWQARLQGLDGMVKKAWESREEEGAPWRKRTAGLKEENRFLRAMVGWDPPPESEDEDGDEEGELLSDGKGQGSRESQGEGERQGDRQVVPQNLAAAGAG